ncbi:hypothetical protein WBP06_20940 [Novosphingobium sp. BL-8H]|uniref:hypothetical protein n=1 Tax=Novosphingobium sp. BL-8H TaxID=3127640 RepID=UPI0037582816
MVMLSIAVEALGLSLGSLLLAIALAMAAYRVAEYFHHPRLATVFLVGAAAAALVSGVGKSDFVKMVCLFAALCAVMLFFAAPDEGAPSKERGARLPTVNKEKP